MSYRGHITHLGWSWDSISKLALVLVFFFPKTHLSGGPELDLTRTRYPLATLLVADSKKSFPLHT